jgi:hypothetical protein
MYKVGKRIAHPCYHMFSTLRVVYADYFIWEISISGANMHPSWFVLLQVAFRRETNRMKLLLRYKNTSLTSCTHERQGKKMKTK